MSRPGKKLPDFYIRIQLPGNAHRSGTRPRSPPHIPNRPHNWWGADHDTRRVWLLLQRPPLTDRPGSCVVHNIQYDFPLFCRHSHKDCTVSHPGHPEALAAARTRLCWSGGHLRQFQEPFAVAAVYRPGKRRVLWKCWEM